MTRRERTYLLVLWFFLGLLPLLVRPLWEPDEGRYAEIPREMLATGDWLTPRLNGVLYFEKPPLQYWLSALSMKLFGLNGAAARLPLALANGAAVVGWPDASGHGNTLAKHQRDTNFDITYAASVASYGCLSYVDRSA